MSRPIHPERLVLFAIGLALCACGREQLYDALSLRVLVPVNLQSTDHIRHLDRRFGEETIPVTRVTIPANLEPDSFFLYQPLVPNPRLDSDAFRFSMDASREGLSFAIQFVLQDMSDELSMNTYGRYDRIPVQKGWTEYCFRLSEFNEIHYRSALPLKPPVLREWLKAGIQLKFDSFGPGGFSFDLGPVIVYKEPARFRFY